ncbi:MAG: hypothetical protein ACRENE_24250 [Polyangiaceae bacterium]
MPLEHGQHTGAQSSGLEQAEPDVPDFQTTAPATEAHVVSTFSPAAATELIPEAIVGVDVHTTAGGTPLPASLLDDTQVSFEQVSPELQVPFP